jgi:hypothetical protein
MRLAMPERIVLAVDHDLAHVRVKHDRLRA